jgi:hypothetical protein
MYTKTTTERLNNLFSMMSLFIGEAQLTIHTLDAGDINRDGFIDILQSGGPNRRVFRILIKSGCAGAIISEMNIRCISFIQYCFFSSSFWISNIILSSAW